jgi:hypothetical protein
MVMLSSFVRVLQRWQNFGFAVHRFFGNVTGLEEPQPPHLGMCHSVGNPLTLEKKDFVRWFGATKGTLGHSAFGV